MKVFVTGVAGQLGHDVMNELAKRGYEGIGTDIAPEYSGAADGTAVVSMPYVSLDITDADAVDRVICEIPLYFWDNVHNSFNSATFFPGGVSQSTGIPFSINCTR